MLTAAGVLTIFSGLGLGIPGVYAIWHLRRHGAIARLLGYPTYGEGFFERHGLPTTVPLLLAFVVVCAADLVAGWLLLEQTRAGAVLGLALLPLEGMFWIGFSLPYPPLIAIARVATIVAGWSGVSQ